MLSSADPNEGHHLIAAAQAEGTIQNLITQNVDGLHQRAGSTGVVELHGSIHDVVCLNCSAVVPRAEVQVTLQEMNSEYIAALEKQSGGAQALLGRMARPDGDSIVEVDYSQIRYPDCSACGGMLKPHVVFFGESLPRHVSDQSIATAADADVIVVAGTSLAVLSAFRLVRDAAERADCEIVVITRGPTRADELLNPELRFHDCATDVLSQLLEPAQ